MEWVENLCDLLIVLFRILPFFNQRIRIFCVKIEADWLQIVAGQGNNSFCQVSGLKGQIGKITNWDGKGSAFIYKANIVCQCVGHRGGNRSAKK